MTSTVWGEWPIISNLQSRDLKREKMDLSILMELAQKSQAT